MTAKNTTSVLREWGECLGVFLFLIAFIGEAGLTLVLATLALPTVLFFSAVLCHQREWKSVLEKQAKQILICFLVGVVPGTMLVYLMGLLNPCVLYFLSFSSAETSIVALATVAWNALYRHAWLTMSVDTASTLLQTTPEAVKNLPHMQVLGLLYHVVVIEYLKLWIVRGICSLSFQCLCTVEVGKHNLAHPGRLAPAHSPKRFQWFVVWAAVVAGALGYGTWETVIDTFDSDEFAERAKTALMGVLLRVTAHAASAAVTGVRLINEHRQLRATRGGALPVTARVVILWPAVVLHLVCNRLPHKFAWDVVAIVVMVGLSVGYVYQRIKVMTNAAVLMEITTYNPKKPAPLLYDDDDGDDNTAEAADEENGGNGEEMHHLLHTDYVRVPVKSMCEAGMQTTGKQTFV